MHAFKYFVKVLIFFVFIFISLAITAFHISKYMRDQSAANDQYFQTFDKIKTDQFNSSFGGGGIYWLSDKSVVLRGVVEEDGGQPVYGLYKVTLDGKYTRLVDVIDRKAWSYCVSQGVVYLRSRTRKFKILTNDTPLVIRQSNLKDDTNIFSPIRCDYVNMPREDKDYLPLLDVDGLIELPRNKKDRYYHNYLVVRNDGKVNADIDNIPFRTTSTISTKYYEFFNGYFGFDVRQDCIVYWYLKRADWSVSIGDYCLGSWAYNNSKVLSLMQVGFFVEHHSSKKPAAYLIKNGNEYLIDTVSARAAAVSPDGCKVAYASGDYRRRKSLDDYRQTLKVFNACRFIKDKESIISQPLVTGNDR